MTGLAQLTETYSRLSRTARHLAQVAAVSLQPTPKPTLAKMSAGSNWRLESGELLTLLKSTAAIRELVKAGVLKTPRGLGVLLARDFVGIAVHDALRQKTFESIASSVQKIRPSLPTYYWSSTSQESVERDMRIAFYRNDEVAFTRLAERVDMCPTMLDPYDAELFENLHPKLQDYWVVTNARSIVQSGSGSRAVLEILSPYAASRPKLTDQLREAWTDLCVARGDSSELAVIDGMTGGQYPEIRGCIEMLRGNFDAADLLFEDGIKLLKAGTRKRKVTLGGFAGVFHVLLQLGKQSPAGRLRGKELLAAARSQWTPHFSCAVDLINDAIECLSNPTYNFSARGACDAPTVSLISGWLWRWTCPTKASPVAKADYQRLAKKFSVLGLQWMADEFLRLAENKPSRSENSESVSLLGLVKPLEPWERSLTALESLAGSSGTGGTTSNPTTATERLIWSINLFADGTNFDLKPFAQKSSKKGGWLKGRPIALKRLYQDWDDETFDFLTDQDREICRLIEENVEYGSGWGRYREVSYILPIKAVQRLAGHPLIFRGDDRTSPLELVRQEPRLIVQKDESKKRLTLRFDHQPPKNAEFQIVKDGPHRLTLLLFSERQRQLQTIIGKQLEIPEAALDRVIGVVQPLASLMTVHSEVGGVEAAQTVDADSRPQVHLVPFQDGVRAEFHVRPFGEAGPFARPGEGGETVFADIEGHQTAARRQFSEELQLRDTAVAACPSLQEQDEVDGIESSHEFYFPTVVEALELAIQLQPLVEQKQIVLHWPQGKRFEVAGQASESQMQVRIKKDRDWFAASGNLVVDKDLSLDMMRLIELVESSTSRFVQLDDGRFLALTEQLRRRVEELGAFGDRQKNKMRFPVVRSTAIEEISNSLKVTADKHWKECLSRIREAGDVCPEVPSTLQTELRDYQVEGFRWLSRLAHWGAGACLADDMGLGKTIQALALLLDRAEGGPALVVAPTSVTFNWVDEAARFAPTLNVRLFGGGDREAFLKDLGPRDVVITSYGLLHNEAERFEKLDWQTVVLDEAQAIKNGATRRSQAAMSLSANFRIIMTGTPVENHLGELWNLFRFINPGLLGSEKMFQTRFAGPIERNKDKGAKQRLKKLVQPFILRRAKSKVLEELPSRTEITLSVELSKDEAAFYEAVRKRAVEKLADLSGANDQQPQHLAILAEIMRLRRACCHPKLVLPESGLSSSKLKLFTETIDELLSGNHKVLVFSQFVDHLSILREELDRQKISYQYLDGSTPVKKRQERVNAFQSGEGDVFLISLKAGGTGLNLTAADYVIHMDPWWNPAVEDQAADRAHRIGQQRPVTIYRLITRGTIEEQILELHRSKRDLADSLLEGTDGSSRLSAEDLLAMLRG
ncbi:MAG: DEAD/DEAH box helicase [Planctomycetota bacterium]|nr:DEAD/DEAH box helicase [Planctomycetota bacterium]MDA1163448.1 DEAD/DEAH box helicase [Planctomycetota bacterium]